MNDEEAESDEMWFLVCSLVAIGFGVVAIVLLVMSIVNLLNQ